MRKGALAVPAYFIAVGVGHVALALYWSDKTVGLPRDGQAFSGTTILGVGFALLGLLALPAALAFERSIGAFARGALAGVVVAGAVVASTASRGYLMGGVTDGPPCIVDPSGLCARGAGTYIADAQPDPFVMLVAVLVAYALAHTAARLAGRGMSPRSRAATRP